MISNEINHQRVNLILAANNQKNIQLKEELISGHSSSQLKILQKLTSIINYEQTQTPQLLEVILQTICDAVDIFQFGLIALHNPQSTQLDLIAKAGINTENLFFLSLNNQVDIRNESLNSLIELNYRDLSLLEQVFITGKPLLYKKNTNECISNALPDLSSLAPYSMYIVPIDSAQTGCLGVLAIGNWDTIKAIDIASQQLLDTVSGIIAIAIQKTRAIATLAEYEQRLARQTEQLLEQNRELEKTRQQIHLQSLQLLETAKLKSEFLATTSHELRTPLNIILGFSQVLLRQRDANLSEQQTDMVQRILTNGNKLLEVIEDMLYCAQAKDTCIALKLEEFNLTNLLKITVAEYRALATEKNVDLQLEINMENASVTNDKLWLKQVLNKLLLNAIKFTDTGNILVKLWEKSPDRIAIAIQDTGIGIAETDLENIFEQFRQVDQTTTRKYSGTGLGLAITKSLVEIMQGSITVTSKLDEGSTFSIELPRKIVISMIHS